MSLGSFFWFIPPMVARLLYEADVLVMGAQLNNPAEAAFAVASINLLPLGMTGMIVVAMFAATMSSMDSGINRNAAVFVRDIYPALCRLVGRDTVGEKGLLLLGRIVFADLRRAHHHDGDLLSPRSAGAGCSM
jgi:solute:Na+ symporter, SSS family